MGGCDWLERLPVERDERSDWLGMGMSVCDWPGMVIGEGLGLAVGLGEGENSSSTSSCLISSQSTTVVTR